VDASTIVGLGSDALRVEVPPAAAGTVGLVDVRLVTPETEVRLENGFLYTGSRDPALPPSLAAVRPEAADPSGGTPVRILGSSLDKVDVVRFGDQEVEFERVSSTELLAVSPARRGGVVSLTVADSSAEMAGAPLPFVFKEGGVAGRRLNVTVPGGCSAAGTASPISALALLPLFMLGRRRRAVLGLLVVGLLAGCHGEDTLRSLRGGALVADAVILPGNGQAIEIGVGSSVVLSGERSGAEASAGLEYDWSVVQAPDGAAPGIERAVDLVGAHDDDRRVVFTPDVVGTYLVQLSLLDRRGSRSAPDAVVVQVVPGRELSVELSWGTGGADLDLHLVRDGGAYFAEGDAFYGAPQPSWGTLSDPDDDPRHLGDHDGTGGTPPGEGVRIPSAPEGRYTVLVHYFNDRMMGETVEGSLRVSVGGEISTLPVSTRDLLAGEVWRAFTVSMPDGTVTAVDELTTHDSLGGPVVNGRG
jgi:Synergist-CTERM protein sorting domain-containing protein